MRNLFPGFYKRTQSDYDDLWTNGLIVLDTNVLLDFHRWSRKTATKLIEILENHLAHRLWIPHRVAEEYHRNLEEVRYKQTQAYADLRKMAEVATNALTKLVQDRRGQHPDDKWGEIHTALADALKKSEEAASKEEQRARREDDQSIVERVAALFDGKVGPAWTPDELDKARTIAELRLKNKRPPGTGKDEQKSLENDSKYGDPFLWLQLLDHVEKDPRSVIFVTADAKDDWWLTVGGLTRGPNPPLVQEVWERAKVLYHSYRADAFVEEAGRRFNVQVQDTVKEVKQDADNRESNADADVRSPAAIFKALAAGNDVSLADAPLLKEAVEVAFGPSASYADKVAARKEISRILERSRRRHSTRAQFRHGVAGGIYPTLGEELPATAEHLTRIIEKMRVRMMNERTDTAAGEQAELQRFDEGEKAQGEK